MRWAMISNGSSKRTSGSRFSPMTFLIEYLCRMRRVRASSPRTRSRSASTARRNSPWLREKSRRLASSPVSSSVPSASTSRAESSIRSLLACVPQFMPEALFITMPPAIALRIEAGSGGKRYPKGFSTSLIRAPTTPGWSRTARPPSSTSQRSQCLPATTSTESLTACPERLVPAARKVRGTSSRAAARMMRTISSSWAARTTICGTSR